MEDRFTLEAPKKAKHPGLDLRRVFVWSAPTSGPAKCSPATRAQEERRYGNFKGPLAVEQPADRSAAQRGLLGLVDLLSRRTRGTTSDRPELKITGLGGYRDARPTGRNLFNAPGELRLIPATTNAPPIVPAPTGLQARILELLDVVPAPLAHSKEPKHMTTRHPLMCGTPG